MNNRKAKVGISSAFILGLIFTILGSIFMILGIALYSALGNEMEEAVIFLLTFGGIGTLFFIIGISCLLFYVIKRRKTQRLLDNGNYIMAEITEISQNYNVNMNGKCPFVVHCQYQTMDGIVHIFKSRNIYFNPETLLLNQQVRVYYDNENFKNYYVDIDEVLPKVVNH